MTPPPVLSGCRRSRPRPAAPGPVRAGGERARAPARQGPRAGDAGDARAGVCGRDRLRRSRATSPPTSRAAPSSATCCCGLCSLANVMAMLIQYLSAKLGIVTDRNLPELCREHYPRPVTWGLWVQAELMAMSTDIAEFLGAALGLNLLFHVPLLPAGVMTGFIAFGILELQRHGFRRFELAITGAARDHLPRLPLRDAEDRPVRLRLAARGLLPSLHGIAVALPRGRDHRRDRDAARDLPPLGADQGPHARPQRRASAAASSASSASTS